MAETTIVYCFGAGVLPGPAVHPEGWDDRPLMERDYAVLVPDPRLTHEEAKFLLGERHVFQVLYSLQQSDFARHGFEVQQDPWKVVMPVGAVVVTIGCMERYDIFRAVDQVEVVHCGQPHGNDEDAIEGWRAGPYHSSVIQNARREANRV